MTEMMDAESEDTPRSACYRCHSQKLRCVQARGQNDCVRCSRAGAVCVTRPSKRVRQGKSMATRKERVSSEALSACNSSHGSKASASELSTHARTHDFNGFDCMPSWESLDGDHHISLPTVESGLCSPGELHWDSVIASSSLSGMNSTDNQSTALNTASLPMEMVEEWSNQQDSTHGSGDDRSYQRNTEEDRDCDWPEALFCLHAKLGQHERSTLNFVETCLNGFASYESLPSSIQSNSSAELTKPRPKPTCPFEKIFDLSMQLLLLIDKVSKQTDDVDRAENTFMQFETSFVTGQIDQTGFKPLVYLADKANLFLLLSCYTRLLGSFCSVFECFHRIITSSHTKNSQDCAVRYILSFLPRIQMGDVTLCANPRFDLAMIMNSAENTLNELHGSMKKALFGKRLDGPPAKTPESLVGCFLEQPGESPSSNQGGLSEVAQNWEITIRDINSTALNVIQVLKESV